MSAVLRPYLAERFPWGMSCVVPLLLAIAAQSGRARSVAAFPVDVLLAFLLFAQFRILDDVADRSHDARIHPERTLVRATRVQPIAAAGLLLAFGTMAVLLVRSDVGSATTTYLILIITLSTWYVVRRERTLFGDHLLLAKYPAFVWIIATSRVGSTVVNQPATPIAQLALSVLATYLAACVYEALHDDRSPSRARPALVVSEGVLLAATLVALSMRGTV
jgi:4-hydroxybenzoate polyprenyltransferase